MAENAVISPDAVPVTFIRDDETAARELAVLREAVSLALDTETVIERDEEGNPLKRDLNVEAEGDGPGTLRVVSLAIRLPDESLRAFVLDMGYVSPLVLKQALTKDSADIENGWQLPAEDPRIEEDLMLRPFMWNAPFDRLVLRRIGIHLLAWDAMIAEAIERTGAGVGDARTYTSLAKASKKLLGYDIDGKKTVRTDYRTVQERPELSEEEISYAAIDAVCTLLNARIIGAQLEAAGLTQTFVRDANGQPFISMMTTAALPMDGPGYRARVDVERRAAAVAAERVALATTGREMLETLFKWGTATGRISETEFDAAVALDAMHDGEMFTAFLTDVSGQVNASRTRMGEILGAKPVEDLFSDAEDATFIELPFDPDNDVEVKKWISKNAPHFAAATAMAARDEGEFATLAASPAAEVIAAAGRRKTLVKDHDLEEVLSNAREGVADVSAVVAAMANELSAYRRYARILTHYQLPTTGEEGPENDPGKAAVKAEGEPTGTYLVPTWDLASAPQVKTMFNTYAPERVQDYFTRVEGKPRLLEKADSVDGDACKMIGGELADALLEWRKRSKIVSTYGDEMLKLINPVTGRVHARYNQSLTGTGRLSSFKPNAQNLSPLVKPYITPPKQDGVVRRVLVCADLSQAELRFVADAAQDEEMLSAFRSGVDLHTRTASLMFDLDLVTLKGHDEVDVTTLVGVIENVEKYFSQFGINLNSTDASESDEAPKVITAAKFYKVQRQKAKQVAFGYAYGLKGGSLGRQLTVQGVPTTKEEADELLAKFDVAYPQVAAWMAQRVKFIADLSDAMRDVRRPCGVDFAASWTLHNTHQKSHSAFNALSKTLERTPTDVELANKLKPSLVEAEKALAAEAAGENPPSVEQVAARQAEIDAERARVAQLANWALAYDHAVVLRPDGLPWEFESRTAGGRRRRFQVVTKQLMLAVVVSIARTRRSELARVRDAWVVDYNTRKAAEHAHLKEQGKARGEYKPVSVTKKTGENLESRELEKLFEDQEMRNDFVLYALSVLPAGQMEKVWRQAMADRIRAMGNQYRNHPIQGGVADAVMLAFGDIYRDLRKHFPTAVGIQSVHDSIVVECDVEDAIAVRDMVVKRMQDALASFCPTVPCVADGDVQLSLDDSTIQSDEQLAELVRLAHEAKGGEVPHVVPAA